MDDIELYKQEIETRAWLRDLDNFGRPPPPKHLPKDERLIESALPVSSNGDLAMFLVLSKQVSI